MEFMSPGRAGDSRVCQSQAAASGFGYGFATAQTPVWSLSQLLLATGGRFVSGRTEATFRSVSTDTRSLEAGDLFLALVGENFDGHEFIRDAVNKGAAGIIASRLPAMEIPVPLILVKDTLTALGDLAAYRRAMMPDLKVIAITGSSGKTTVKEMTAAILAKEFNVLKTTGNFNNLVGMPLSLLPVEYRHEMAVMEMGMNRPDEIARLTEIADPDLACITNVQEAHLEGVSDINGVAKAKGELFAGIKTWGKLAVNIDDKRVKKLAAAAHQEKITFGRSRKAFIRATHIRGLGEKGMSFTLHIGHERSRVVLRSIGAHNVLNALAAAALCYGVGLGIDRIEKGLAAFCPYDKRLQVQLLPGGLRLVNDAYNANPASMLAALETMQGLKRDHRAIVILGDMLELGKQSVASHRFVGKLVARLGFDYLLAFGSFADSLVDSALAAGMGKKTARKFQNKEEIVNWLKEKQQAGELARGDWILLKGSRGMRMETILEGLMK